MSVKTSVHAYITNDHNEVLLTQRADIPIWVMPGGTVKQGELLETALMREVHEEIGLEIGDLKKVMKSKLGLSYKYVYTAKVVGGTIKLDSKEVRSLSWVSPQRLLSPISLFEKNRIIKVSNFDGSFISEESTIDKKREILHLMRTPISFFWVLFSYLWNHLRGETKFRI
ncbi:NUDIX hydrolase [Patescibacteria group bacterium]|nr:NUDIX hydrolase [Patescibacteria group bacterium]